jgi:hypothetical protein
MSTPSSPMPNNSEEIYRDEGYLTPDLRQSTSKQPLTRTVAIIKPHALQHRFDIEHRIQEAGFEVREHFTIEIGAQE